MNKRDLLVLLDCGHGSNTPGKRSPDSKLKEWAYVREIAGIIMEQLYINGIAYKNIHPEPNELGTTRYDLSLRASRANTFYKNTIKKCILISIHVNAASNGDWKNATGWSAYTTKGVTQSDLLAECLYDAAEEILTPLNKKIRTDTTDGDRDYEENFYVLKHTIMPAVLTENFFMDNKEDCEWLLSPKGKLAIADIHVKGILKYVDRS